MPGQIPPKARPKPQRSCMELGMCQARTPACTGCTHHTDEAATYALDASAQASRDTGCTAMFGRNDADDFNEVLTPMERIAYWAAVGFAVGLSVVAAFGTAGYLSVRALGL